MEAETGKHGHYTLFFQEKMCHPGYQPPECAKRLRYGNPFYTADCPNLEHSDNTLWPLGEEEDDTLNIRELGGCIGCNPAHDSWNQPFICAYLCYSHEDYGITVIPKTIWHAVQDAEGGVWKSMGGANQDQADKHTEGFGQYKSLSEGIGGKLLGDVIEVGSGPWTQSRFMLQVLPEPMETTVKSFTVYEPGAEFYMQNVQSCAYKDGLLISADCQRKHTSPYTFWGREEKAC